MDLPRSISDAAEHYRAEEGMSTEKLFWSQHLGPEHPVPFSDQLKQLVELHRSAELAMKDMIAGCGLLILYLAATLDLCSGL